MNGRFRPWPNKITVWKLDSSRPDESRPVLLLLLSPGTPSPAPALLRQLQNVLHCIDQRSVVRYRTDPTRTGGSSYRLYGPWTRPADACTALILLFSDPAFSLEASRAETTDPNHH